ncbi:MAG: citramalate synthase [Alphaproteobacteria bacterium]
MAGERDKTSQSDQKVYLFDSTLRDGAQTEGVDFTVADKIAIARALDQVGVDYIEGGWPGANPTDDAFFAEPPALVQSKLVGFGMTRRPGRSVQNDPGLAAILDCQPKAACLVGKAWDFHVDVALGIDRQENLDMIAESIMLAKARLGEAMFDAEHFFDGYKANSVYALSCLEAAYEAGARWVVLCDTNGGTLPHEIEHIVNEVTQRIPGSRLGIHCHNDTENAVANSLAAVRAGVRQVQGTINGLGERCGNANLISLIPSLILKMGMVTNIPREQLPQLTHLSRLLDERLGRAHVRNAAYVGESAFAHKGGLHVSAVEKDPRTYEHIPPEVVGNHRRILVSDQAGRANILAQLSEIGLIVDPKDPRVMSLVDKVKENEFRGYAYDGAEASFEILARRALGGVPEYFRLLRFKVSDEHRHNAKGELVTESEAIVNIIVGDNLVETVAKGNGPINALDSALRKALSSHYAKLSGLRLIDYKVRILPPPPGTSGTAAVTRVRIESRDETGVEWSTVGISGNIIDASYEALADSLTYKLLRDGVSA